MRNSGRKILIYLSFTILLLTFLFFGYISTNLTQLVIYLIKSFVKDFNIDSFHLLIIFQVYIPLVSICFLIILTEYFHVITINLFIRLVPTEDLKICCLNSSTVITIVTKFARLFPSLLIILNYLVYPKIDGVENFLLGKNFGNTQGLKFNFCNLIMFSLQGFNYFICIVLCIVNYSSLKPRSLTRILGLIN